MFLFVQMRAYLGPVGFQNIPIQLSVPHIPIDGGKKRLGNQHNPGLHGSSHALRTLAEVFAAQPQRDGCERWEG